MQNILEIRPYCHFQSDERLWHLHSRGSHNHKMESALEHARHFQDFRVWQQAKVYSCCTNVFQSQSFLQTVEESTKIWTCSSRRQEHVLHGKTRCNPSILHKVSPNVDKARRWIFDTSHQQDHETISHEGTTRIVDDANFAAVRIIQKR